MKFMQPPVTFIQIQCVSCNNTSATQTDCLMFGLDKDGQVWEKGLQDKVWTKTPMDKEKQ